MPACMQYTTGDGAPIVGEAKDAAHRGWIELESFGWGNDKAEPHDFVVTRALERTSTQLMRESIAGVQKSSGGDRPQEGLNLDCTKAILLPSSVRVR